MKRSLTNVHSHDQVTAEEAYHTLASDVICQAIYDWRRKRLKDKEELSSFFAGQWFEALSELAHIDPDWIRTKLGISAS